MSATPGDLPPSPGTPPVSPAQPPTRIAGQEHAPASEVPMGPPGAYVQPAMGGYNAMAVVSLATGVLAFFGHIVLPGIGGGSLALVAIVTGFIGRQQIRSSGERGGTMAMIGLILGIVHLVLLVLIVVVILFLVFAFGLALFGLHR